MLGPNFLEFTEHTRSVARLLFKHTGINCEDVAGLKFICCDLDTELTTVVDASGGSGREVVFLRENLNHFVPLTALHITKEDLLPWNTNISTILARRRKTQENALHRAVASRRKETPAAVSEAVTPSALVPFTFGELSGAEEEDENAYGPQRASSQGAPVKRQRQSTMFDGLSRAEEEDVNSHGSVFHADTLHQAHGIG